jgi:hypothetical protein
MFEHWTDEEIQSRLETVFKSYQELAEDLLPKLSKLQNLEKELNSLSQESVRRGLIVDTEKE